MCWSVALFARHWILLWRGVVNNMLWFAVATRLNCGTTLSSLFLYGCRWNSVMKCTPIILLMLFVHCDIYLVLRVVYGSIRSLLIIIRGGCIHTAWIMIFHLMLGRRSLLCIALQLFLNFIDDSVLPRGQYVRGHGLSSDASVCWCSDTPAGLVLLPVTKAIVSTGQHQRTA